ncbi:hypothetical protein PC120_g20704 [Phytophthora cactorum]|nr:hypothetical protein PC120_g20704 [Phytophthora cactorum]
MTVGLAVDVVERDPLDPCQQRLDAVPERPEQQRGVLFDVVGAASAWVVVGACPHHGAAGFEEGCSGAVEAKKPLAVHVGRRRCCHLRLALLGFIVGGEHIGRRGQAVSDTCMHKPTEK